MQADAKYVRQLSLALGVIKGSKKQLAQESYRTQPAISKYLKGAANVPNDVKKVAVEVTSNIRLAFSSARSDFGTISFFKSDKLRTDMFAASVNQHREEQERMQIERDAFVAMAIPAQERKSADWDIINCWAKEFAEEIGSEINELISSGEYTGADIQAAIDDYNKQFGG
ncbi:hypothetical protein [Furfurilactobacillus entadae]|uniref:hypothetical protein n=1 Tax=Furfurilactobacillus entadae TaxID=2922307 RepID=UPI0035EEB794